MFIKSTIHQQFIQVRGQFELNLTIHPMNHSAHSVITDWVSIESHWIVYMERIEDSTFVQIVLSYVYTDLSFKQDQKVLSLVQDQIVLSFVQWMIGLSFVDDQIVLPFVQKVLPFGQG